MSTDMDALDAILDFNPVGGGGSRNDYVEDGCWLMALTEISMPFQEAEWQKPDSLVTKVRFYFEIVAGYDKKTGEPVASEFDGQKVSIKVKADSNGPKSTKYLLASALLQEDLAAYTAANGPVKPSLLVGLQCWGKIENKPDKKDPNKVYTELAWDGFTSSLPSHLIRPVPTPVAPGQRPVPQRPAPIAQTQKAAPPF